MEKFGWCFIGTGTLANTVAQQLCESGRHKIVSCYTRDPVKCRVFARKFGCIAADSAQAAIKAEGVEGVYVVTPHNAHYRYAKLALEMGVPVLCEKAFTVTAEETAKLISLAKEKNIYLCEAMWTWFGEPANKVKSWLEGGKIGKVRSADFTYCIKSVNYAPRVADPKRAGGALLDITVYPITYAYRLFGYPQTIESTAVLKNGIDCSEEIKMQFEGGIKVNIKASILDYKGLEVMKIRGEKGSIGSLFYHSAKKVSCRNGLFGREVFKLRGEAVKSGYLPEFDTVAREIREGLKESRKVPLKATADVMRILDTVRGQIGLEYSDLE